MIVKIVHTRSAKNLARYASREGKITAAAGAFPLTLSPDEIALHLERAVALNHRCREGQFLHLILSPSKKDRTLALADWNVIAQDAVEGLGLGDCPWQAWVHDEPGKVPHLHIATTQVDSTGARLDMGGERWRAKRVARSLEKKHGLRRVSGVKNGPELPPISVPKIPLAGTLEPKANLALDVTERVRQGLREVVRPGVSLSEVATRLRTHGISLEPLWQNEGQKIGGLGFRVGDAYLKASQVGASLAQLQKQGVIYKPEQDIPAIRTLSIQPHFSEIRHDYELPRQIPIPALTPRQRIERAIRGVGPSVALLSPVARIRPRNVPLPGRFRR